MKSLKFGLLTATALFVTPAMAAAPADILSNYGDIAQASYADSLATAKTLKGAIDKFLAEPTEANLEEARSAWIEARNPYQQTEAYRFGNAIVDDWEGKVNAWPLDEGLIDYVDASYGEESEENPFYAANLIANPSLKAGGETIDASNITSSLLADQLQEAGEVEANVVTGYHAIEFMLWGQDLNGHGSGAGDRPWSDYAAGDDCTNGNCDRRAEYLKAATDLLVSDLEWMAAQWTTAGEARATLMANEDAGLAAILTGMGSLSYGEQAGERMRLGLMLNDPEEEHDCFSDNTHNSHFYDGMGIQNVYLGEYVRVDGSLVSGASLSDMVAAVDADLDTEMSVKLSTTMMALGRIKTAAEAGVAYDQMLERGNAAGEALIMGGVEGLIDQTRSIERVVTALGLDQIAFEGSDSLDDPDAVFQ